MEVLTLALAFALDISLSWAILRRDIARMPPEQRARSWGSASLGSALFLCQRWCLLVHFPRTRRSFRGLGLGLGAVLGVSVAVMALVELLSGLATLLS